MKQSRIDFIKEAHSAACSIWKERIEKEFPKIFKDEFKVGDWVVADRPKSKNHIGLITKIEGKKYHYNGRNSIGDLMENDYYFFENNWVRKATHSEISDFLIAEAKRRGYGNGNYKCLDLPTVTYEGQIIEYIYRHDHDQLVARHNGRLDGCNVIYRQGQWAERIEQIPVDVRDIICKYGKEELKKYL